MHPFILVGAIAGAFFLGRRSAEKKKRRAPSFPIPKPTPLPLPPGIDVPDVELPELDLPSLEAATTDHDRIINGAAWAKTGFDVEVYPAGADKFAILPPPSASGLSASRDCGIVAVGFRWWDRAGQIAQQLKDENLLTMASLERALLPPQCRGLGAQGKGLYHLREELRDRLQQEFGQIRNPRRRRRWW